MKSYTIMSLIFLLAYAPHSFCVLHVQLPDEKTLNDRLADHGISQHFVEKTEISANLSNKSLPAFVVAAEVWCSIFKYIQYVPSAINYVATMQPSLLEALLEDSPEELKNLENQGLYRPHKLQK